MKYILVIAMLLTGCECPRAQISLPLGADDVAISAPNTVTASSTSGMGREATNAKRSTDGSEQTTAVQGVAVEGAVRRLERLIAQEQVTELRTVYNGSYGASLLLHASELTYYVALFENKSLWRVIATGDPQNAEKLYASFCRKSAELAEVELHRIHLNAETALVQRTIVAQQKESSRLQSDLTIAREQAKEVQVQQSKDRENVELASGELARARSNLLALQAKSRKLQHALENDSSVSNPRQ